MKHLTAVGFELKKECDTLIKKRDELAENNTKLQIEVMEWQDEWYNMKMATKSARHQLLYPKRSQRIYKNLRIKQENRSISRSDSIYCANKHSKHNPTASSNCIADKRGKHTSHPQAPAPLESCVPQTSPAAHCASFKSNVQRLRGRTVSSIIHCPMLGFNILCVRRNSIRVTTR